MKKLFVIMFCLAIAGAVFATPGKVKWFNEKDNNGNHGGWEVQPTPVPTATPGSTVGAGQVIEIIE